MTLKRAAEIVGGEQQLALHLRVTPSHLALWLQGIESPPDYIFLKAVDLVTEHDTLPKASPEPRPRVSNGSAGPLPRDDGPPPRPGKHVTSR